jgi:hypothetical protein
MVPQAQPVLPMPVPVLRVGASSAIHDGCQTKCLTADDDDDEEEE